MTNIEYLKSFGLNEEIIDDEFLSNAIEVYHAYFGSDKVKVIIEYAKMKREAFLKPKEKDVLDTGARLPEQKEEAQIDLWREVLEIHENNGSFATPFVDVIQSKFIIHRKP